MNKKYLLLARNSQNNKKEIENEPLPVTFSGNGHRLRNYRIYGNDGGVGDWRENGKYLVPVTVQGKNLLKNTAVSQTVNGVTFTVNDDGSVTCNGTANGNAVFRMLKNPLFDSLPVILSGCPAYSTYYSLQYSNYTDYAYIDKGSEVTINNMFDYTKYNSCYIHIYIYSGYTCNNLTFYPMIRKASVEDNHYEPCHEPQTVNIELDEPLGEGEYIDFREQKRYPSGEMISLPVIPTIDGTNIITVDTETQPSQIWLQGDISVIETISSQSLQANIQDLQPLSLDDENLELDVMPVEIPVRLNEISPTIGGVENAE